MSENVCPKCKQVLNKESYYFCANCGEKLPEDYIKSKASFRVRKYPLNFVKSKFFDLSSIKGKLIKGPKLRQEHSLNKRFALYLVAVSILLSLGFLIDFSTLVDKAKEMLPFGLSNETVQLADFNFGLPLETRSLNYTFFADYLPKDTSFVLLSGDLDNFFKMFFLEEEVSSRMDLLLDDEFALFSHKEDGEVRWGYLFIPKDISVVKAFISEGSGFSFRDMKFEIVGDLLVASESPGVFEVVSESKDKVRLSLSLNPDYSRNINGLPEQGQIVVMFLQPGSRFDLREFTKDLSPEFGSFIGTVLDKNLDYLVIGDN